MIAILIILYIWLMACFDFERSGQAVEKEIDGGNATVPGDDKIGSRVSWWFAASARYPSNPSGITQFLGREEELIFEIWMCCFYLTSNTINLVTATKYAAFGVIEYCVFVKDLVDCSPTKDGVIFAKYVAQITKQQGRYAIGHGSSPLRLPFRRLHVNSPAAAPLLSQTRPRFAQEEPRVSRATRSRASISRAAGL